MKKQAIGYSDGKTSFKGQLVWDDALSGPRPGVLVFPEAFGLNDHALQRAQRLAQLGYVALAVDPHGEGRVYSDLPSVVPVIKGMYAERGAWRARLQAALDALLAQPQVDGRRIGAIGFCFGGACCFELARSGAALSAVTTFHAGLLPEQEGDAGRIRAKVLICHGADDPLVKRESLDAVTAELRRDGVDWQLASYGGAGHSFTDPTAGERKLPGFGYHEAAERRSWAAMRQLFEEAFA
ncbi:MAG TPA: dienelactone hydrolase family protein [Solimonas sp.]|nr:dienelactone hydrolase family protein [Solimonas sp.]